MRSPPRFAGPRAHHRGRGGTPGSFGQPGLPKTLNQQLRVSLPAASNPRSNCKCGIDLKHTRRLMGSLAPTRLRLPRKGDSLPAEPEQQTTPRHERSEMPASLKLHVRTLRLCTTAAGLNALSEPAILIAAGEAAPSVHLCSLAFIRLLFNEDGAALSKSLISLALPRRIQPHFGVIFG
jgi:hypothetical protein